jgi:hypothetical protein
MNVVITVGIAVRQFPHGNCAIAKTLAQKFRPAKTMLNTPQGEHFQQNSIFHSKNTSKPHSPTPGQNMAQAANPGGI